METETYLYPYSAGEAKDRGELALWRASHQANISCKRAIEESIRQNFDGMRLNNGCVDEVIAKYGYKRTAWVLSNTIQQKDQDGRFSQANKQWAKRTCIPSDHWHNSDFVVESIRQCWMALSHSIARRIRRLGFSDRSTATQTPFPLWTTRAKCWSSLPTS